MKRQNKTSQPPASPAAQPHHEYGKTLLGLASEFFSSEDDHTQLVELLDRHVNGPFSLAESCWIAAQPEGMDNVAYDRLVDHAEDFATLDAVYRDDGWLARFIGDVLDLYRYRDGDVSPEYLLSMLAKSTATL
jgi:hypothetical protein